MGTEHEDPLVRRRDELRRIVYGTREEPPPHVVDELARIEDELAGRERTRAAGLSAPNGATANAGAPNAAAANGAAANAAAANAGTATAGAANAIGEPSVAAAAPGAAVAAPTWEEPTARRRPSARWALVAAVAVVGVALVIGPVRDLLSPPRGLDVFERAQTEEEQDVADQVATAARLDPYAPEQLRSLGGIFGYQFWVYREGDRVCLLSQRRFFFSWEESCSTVDEFRENPLVRRISTDDVRNGARPRDTQPGDIIVVTWGAMSMELEWEIEPPS